MNWNFGEVKHTAAGPWGGDHGEAKRKVAGPWGGDHGAAPWGEVKYSVAETWGADYGAPWDEAKHTVAGPWGGDRGTPWDDGVYSTIRQVVITSSAGINSIQFEYDHNNVSVWCDKHGGDHGIKTDKIKLDYPSEFLVSISGRTGFVAEGGGPLVIKSLSFESNRRKYGPFGIDQGSPFSFTLSGAKLVGFHGRSSGYLDSIGAHVKPLMPKNNPLEIQKKVMHFAHPDTAGPMISATPGFTGRPMIPPTSGFAGGTMISATPGFAGGHIVSTTPRIPGGHVVPSTSVTAHPQTSKKLVSYGPWGGDSGFIFDDGIYTGVREIVITRTGGLVSLRVCYDHNGTAVWGDKNGGTGGLKREKIVFDYPFEVLTHITGYYASTIFRGPSIIKSLTFHTNKRSYGPFGDEQGFSFSSAAARGTIVGFHGRNGYFIHGIGVHVLENMSLNSHSPHLEPFDKSTAQYSEVVWGVPRGAPRLEPSVSEPAFYESGPWGGEGGMPWDDGVYKGIKKILLTKGDAICSIQTEYDLNGQFVWSARHGTANDSCTYQVKFDYPYEILTSITGYYEIVAGDMRKRVIRSLTFHTNKAKYGPYGKTVGTYFSSTNKDGKIAGFHGRSSSCLDAIGVHMQYWVSDESSHRYPEKKGFIH